MEKFQETARRTNGQVKWPQTCVLQADIRTKCVIRRQNSICVRDFKNAEYHENQEILNRSGKANIPRNVREGKYDTREKRT